MSAAFVLMITDGQDTQKRPEDLQQAGYAIARRGAVGQIVTGSKRSTARPDPRSFLRALTARRGYSLWTALASERSMGIEEPGQDQNVTVEGNRPLCSSSTKEIRPCVRIPGR
jgi:hypothetical protein